MSYWFHMSRRPGLPETPTHRGAQNQTWASPLALVLTSVLFVCMHERAEAWRGAWPRTNDKNHATQDRADLL